MLLIQASKKAVQGLNFKRWVRVLWPEASKVFFD